MDEDITEEGIKASDKDTDCGREEHIREMNELLQELRVILLGVQVLFTFLLTVVFTQRFMLLSSYQKDTYLRRKAAKIPQGECNAASSSPPSS